MIMSRGLLGNGLSVEMSNSFVVSGILACKFLKSRQDMKKL